MDSVVGLKKCTACQSFDRRPPSRLRSGPTRLVPKSTGRWSTFWYSSVFETVPNLAVFVGDGTNELAVAVPAGLADIDVVAQLQRFLAIGFEPFSRSAELSGGCP